MITVISAIVDFPMLKKLSIGKKTAFADNMFSKEIRFPKNANEQFLADHPIVSMNSSGQIDIGHFP